MSTLININYRQTGPARYVLGEFDSAVATISFQLCGGVLSSPRAVP
jgi:hypothetical protein